MTLWTNFKALFKDAFKNEEPVFRKEEEPVDINSEEFRNWCFGNPPPRSSHDKMLAWNRLHGDKLIITDKCEFFPSVIKMAQLYRKRKKR